MEVAPILKHHMYSHSDCITLQICTHILTTDIQMHTYHTHTHTSHMHAHAHFAHARTRTLCTCTHTSHMHAHFAHARTRTHISRTQGNIEAVVAEICSRLRDSDIGEDVYCTSCGENTWLTSDGIRHLPTSFSTLDASQPWVCYRQVSQLLLDTVSYHASMALMEFRNNYACNVTR